MPKADPLRIIEAGYTWVESDEEWLRGVIDAARPFDVGEGLVGGTVDLSASPAMLSMVGDRVDGSAQKPIKTFVESLPPPVGRAVFAPTEFVGNAAFRLNRLARELSKTKQKRALDGRHEVPPLWALICGDASSHAMMLGFLAPQRDFTPERAYPPALSRALGLVGAHLSAAMRLRRAMKRAGGADDEAEAVLSGDGTVLHARGDATSTRARRSLSEAVIKSERARGRVRRESPEDATRMWNALVLGRWSIVEVIETDGKRLLLARKNPHRNAERAALTKDENDVVWLTALGHSYKYIGYELGFSLSSVVRRLDSAMLKLGVRTRRELMRKLGS